MRTRTVTAAASSRRAILPRLLIAIAILTPLGAPTSGTAAAETETPFLQVLIDQVTPELVTTTSSGTVTVTGVVTNIGDRPVRDVVARLEYAPAVTASSRLRTDLTGNVDQYQPVGEFVTLDDELDRDQTVPFTLSYPLRSTEQPSLAIEQPGVYPVLVNVNGTPDYGAPARLDDARFLLPVLGVPAAVEDESAPPTGEVLASVVAPDTSNPVRLTLLWPLGDRPRLAAGAPGGTTPVRLTDDELATSLAPGGRLDTLVATVEFATSPTVDPAGQMGRALCLAVDPDLLVTVNAMTAGYVVNDGPDIGIATRTRPGEGQEAAVNWLNRVRELAQRLCVAPTTYAQADLDALHRVGDRGLSAIATSGSGAIVDQLLGVVSTRGASLLGDGPLTGSAIELLTAQGPTVAIAAAEAAGQDSAAGLAGTADQTPVRYTPYVTAAPFDPAVGAALAGAGADPITPSYLDQSLEVPLQHDSPLARRQDAVGAVLWRTLQPDAEPRSEILLPPLTWNLQAVDAQSILSAVATAIRAGLAVPHPLTAVISETAAVPAQDSQPLPPDGLGSPRGHFDESVTTDIRAVNGRLWGLSTALTTDARTGLTGTRYTAPLREDMLRALSQSVPPGERNPMAHQRLRAVANTVSDMFEAVTIVNPGGSYTLATERSPLPLALRNNLPVPIRVRLNFDAPPGMTIEDMGVIELPPGYLPLRVPTEVHFTQRVAVDVELRTADGVPLGEPVRLSVHSNAYGSVLFIITLSAAAVLVLLAGRRLWHRFRGQPDRADLYRPDPLEVALHYAPEEDTPERHAAPPPHRPAPMSRGDRP